MDFPVWAPKILIDKYLEAKLNDNKKHSQKVKSQNELLFKLITDTRMEKTWKMLLSKRKPDKLNDYGYFLMPYHLFFQILVALEEMQSEHLSRREESNVYKQIAKAAQHLSALMRNSNLDRPVFQWYSSEEIISALEDIKEERCEGHFCLIDDIDEVNKKGAVYERLGYLLDSEIGVFSPDENLHNYYRIAENTADWFQKQVISAKHSKISSILVGVENDANNLAERAITRKKFMEKPNSVSGVTIFIRTLYVNYWKDEFDGPLFGTFARLCNVVVDSDSVDNKMVRDALEGFR